MVGPSIAVNVEAHAVHSVSEVEAIAADVYQDGTRGAAAALPSESRVRTSVSIWIRANIDPAISTARLERRRTRRGTRSRNTRPRHRSALRTIAAFVEGRITERQNLTT